MSLEHISHNEIKAFAEERVNLPAAKVAPFREQANRLRDKLKDYLKEHPDFELRKMLLSGSLAKGTALSTINDIDIAVYISGVDDSYDAEKLLNYLIERLQSAFPNFEASQIEKQTYSIKVHFKGTDLDIDVVPVIYNGDPDDKGDLISQYDGSRLMTSIPMHLKFFRTRKEVIHPQFAEVVRLVKWWVKECKKEDDEFRFKSFMVEMILCHLLDKKKLDCSDYVEALLCFFDYVVSSKLKETIIFADNYSLSDVAPSGIIRIYDPVNPKNNVAATYTSEHASLIVNKAMDASDAICAAQYTPTKSETIRHWQRVFGSTF